MRYKTCRAGRHVTLFSNHTVNTTGFAVSNYGPEDGGGKDLRDVLVLVNLTMYQAQISIFNKRVNLSTINFELDYSELICMTGTKMTALTGTLGVLLLHLLAHWV